MDLTKFWEKKVAKGHKHFANELSSVKKKRLRGRFEKHVLGKVNFVNVHRAIDWGCGGGLLAKIVPDHVKLHLVDISDECLHRTAAYVAPRKVTMDQITDPSTFEFEHPKADLLWCYSVIHHFPNKDWWIKTAALWEELAPKKIAIHTKIGKKDKTAASYSIDSYFNGLILSKKSLLEPFKSYKLLDWSVEKASANWNHGFALLGLK
jgi:2-polyprenyl-3-methyl-5-hydroxy-6-metoxy-1,4-benzoquinol methylase